MKDKNEKVKRYRQTEKGKEMLQRRDKKRRETIGGQWSNTIGSRIRRALKRGELTKTPCVDCGSLQVEAHHRDYSKPLDVTWLCRKCHIKRHGGKPF